MGALQSTLSNYINHDERGGGEVERIREAGEGPNILQRWVQNIF